MTLTSRNLFAGLVAALLAAAAASATYQRLAERRDDRRFPPPGELVDIGDRRLHVIRTGTTGPVMNVLPALAPRPSNGSASNAPWPHAPMRRSCL